MYAKLLGIGVVYGLGFTIIKSLFPTPVILLFAGGQSSEGDLTMLASVYMGSGLLAGVIGGPLFGALLLRRRGSGTNVGRFSAVQTAGADLWRSLVLSFLFALLIGLISGLLTMDFSPRPTPRHARRPLPGTLRRRLFVPHLRLSASPKGRREQTLRGFLEAVGIAISRQERVGCHRVSA